VAQGGVKNNCKPEIVQYRPTCTSSQWRIFLGGGGLRLPPFQPTIIFHDGIFDRFTKFFLPKHQNLGIH